MNHRIIFLALGTLIVGSLFTFIFSHHTEGETALMTDAEFAVDFPEEESEAPFFIFSPEELLYRN